MKEERRMILQMVEEGKITAEEGVALLEALEASAVHERPPVQNHNDANASATHNDATNDFEAKSEEMHQQEKTFEELAQSMRRIGDELSIQGKTVSNKIGDMVERIITKVKELDFDFDFSVGNWPKVEKVFEGTLPAKGIIDLTTVNGKVEVTGWDRPEYRIEIRGAVRAESQIEANAILNELLHFEENEELLKVGVEQRRGTKLSLDVFLPKQIEHDVWIKTSNGAIEMDKLHMSGAKLETSNGAIKINDVHSSGLYCVTSNGRISVHSSHIADLFARTSNGPIRLDGTMGKAKCYTSNGSIRYLLEEVQEGELDFDTTNGSIEVRIPHEGLAVQGDLSTSFGSLDCTLPNIEITSASKEIAHRHLSFKTKNDEGVPFTIVCKTSNGGIRIHPVKE